MINVQISEDEEFEAWTKITEATVGKYTGLLWSEIKTYDPEYFDWAKDMIMDYK